MTDDKIKNRSVAIIAEAKSPTSLTFQAVTMEGADVNPEAIEFGKRIAASIEGVLSKTFVGPIKALTSAVELAIEKGDHVGAAQAIETAVNNGQVTSFHRVDERLLLAANRIDVSGLERSNRELVRDFRMEVAILIQRCDLAEEDARAILSEVPDTTLSERRDRAFLVLAHAAARKGNRETAIARYRDIVTSTSVGAIAKGWAFRGLAATAKENLETADAFRRQAVDAFLQGQDFAEAIKSLVSLMWHAYARDPEQALQDGSTAATLAIGLPEDRRQTSVVEVLRAVASVAFRAGRFELALERAKEALSLGTNLSVETKSVLLMVAASAASQLQRTEDARRFNEEVKTHLATIVGGDERVRIDILASFEGDKWNVPQELVAAMKSSGSPVMRATAAIREALAPGLSLAERLDILESIRNKLRTRAGDPEVVVPLELAFSNVYLESGCLADALPHCQRVLSVEPTNWSAIQNVAAILERQGRWLDLASHLDSTLSRIGERPGLLFKLGQALNRSGNAGKAARCLRRCLKKSPEGELAHRAQELLDQILESGSAGVEAELEVRPKAISRDVFLRMLQEFSKAVSASMRRAFWRQENGEYKWVPKPESTGSFLLRSFLAGRLPGHAIVIEELTAGAGFIDLYVRFGDGTSFIVELKICGSGYSLSRAKQGIEQLDHYAKNRSGMGFLVVFDARRQEFGQGVAESVVLEGLIVATTFVDVRWEVVRDQNSSTRASG